MDHVSHGKFDVYFPPQHEKSLEGVLSILDWVDKEYTSAGFHLTKPIRVVMAAVGSNRSNFTPDLNTIYVYPGAFKQKGVLIHEMAHWFHFNRVHGGFHNPEIIKQYHASMVAFKHSGGPVEQNPKKVLLEKLRAEYDALANDKTQLAKGMVLNIPGMANPYTDRSMYIRQFKVRTVGKKTCKVEVLNPNAYDKSVAARTGWKEGQPLIRDEDTKSLIYHMNTQDDKARRTELQNQIQKLEGEIVDEFVPSELYESDALHSWMPSKYAMKNPLEWFAELVTYRILKPSQMAPEVISWLASVCPG